MNIGTSLKEINYTDPNGFFNDAPFITTDIHVITLKQHLKDKAADKAWETIKDVSDIETAIDNLLHTQYSSGKEFVLVEPERITVAVNRDKIDIDSVSYAFDLLSNIEGGITERRLIEIGESIKVYEKTNTV